MTEHSEQNTPAWAQGLKKNGLYYEGLVDDHENAIELHCKRTMTTYGTRTSYRTSNEDKENNLTSYSICTQN